MQIHQVKRIHKNKKRITVARGGKRGKTSGRGGKGQSARAGNKRRPEWRDIIKRIPKLRGRGVNQNKPVSDANVVINLSLIEGSFSANENVTPSTLIEKGLVSSLSGNIPKIKILGDGEITKIFNISGCAISESAKNKIEKAGGSVISLPSRVIAKQKGPTVPSDKILIPVKVTKVKKEKTTKVKVESVDKKASEKEDVKKTEKKNVEKK